MRSLAFIVVAALVLSSTASAEGCTKDAESVVQHIFEKADQDRDGNLTRSEYEAAGLQGFGVSFEESDTDGNGGTSIAEYLDLYRRHHPAGEEREA
jgi:hypothetical protein